MWPPDRRAQDYCGVLNEESLRKNFVLVYELLDEMLDYGCYTAARPACAFSRTTPQLRAEHEHGGAQG
jgi:hypothetical protein